MILLFPQRHICFTRKNELVILQLVGRTFGELGVLVKKGSGRSPSPEDRVSRVVFAITNANMCNTRWDPLPVFLRAVMCDRFARSVLAPFSSRGVSHTIVTVPFYPGLTTSFAKVITKEVCEETEHGIEPTPANTVVYTGASDRLRDLFSASGFSVVVDAADVIPRSPINDPHSLIQHLAEAAASKPGESPSETLGKWSRLPAFLTELSPSSISVFLEFPEAVARIARLFLDPVLTSSGSLTETRDYATYSMAMSSPGVIKYKYSDIKAYIKPGTIVDEGCADGALLALIAKDWPDSDLLGIEIAQEFLSECRERQRLGGFGASFVHFHQRNLLEPILADQSTDTTICNSTTHELWSYGHQESSVVTYLQRKFAQSRPGGRLIIRDVVGPEDKDSRVLLWCNPKNGRNEDLHADKAPGSKVSTYDCITALSTASRFVRFAEDFLRSMCASGRRSASCLIKYTVVKIDGVEYFSTSLREAAEFIHKFDYCDNWFSELCEEFCFWSVTDWVTQITKSTGFKILEARPYLSDWILKNRFEGNVRLFKQGTDGKLTPLPFPPTNVIIAAEKPF